MKPNAPDLATLIKSYVLCMKAEGKSPKTIESYLLSLKHLSKFLDSTYPNTQVRGISVSHIREFILYLQNDVTRWQESPYIKASGGLSPFTVQTYIRPIRSFWSWLCSEGHTEANPLRRLKIPKAPRKIIQTFSQDQINSMLKACDLHSPIGYRDYVIILLFCDTGIRVSELINLEMDDVDLLLSTLTITGKGDKQRIVPFGGYVRRILRRYMNNHRIKPESRVIKTLFLTQEGLPMKRRRVLLRIRQIGKKANIDNVRCSPHTFRHTFAKQYLLNGGDVFTLQQILGHSSLEVVKIYLNLQPEEVTSKYMQYSPMDNFRLNNE